MSQSAAAIHRWGKVVGILIAFSWISLVLHELAHAVVYWMTGHGAWISFQRVHPTGPTSESIEAWSLAVGPLFTFALAIGFYIWARERDSFALSVMAFVNAVFRIFPATIAIVLAVVGADSGFSDEGNLALIMSSATPIRIAIPLAVLGVSGGLTWAIAKTSGLSDWRGWPLVAFYFVSFGVGFLAMGLDSLFGLA